MNKIYLYVVIAQIVICANISPSFGQQNNEEQSPKENTIELNNVSYYSLKATYTIDETDPEERGVKYSTNASFSPETTLNLGTTSGTFIETITGLDHGTTYYFRAYHIKRGTTYYSNTASKTTLTYAAEPNASVTNFAVDLMSTTSLRFTWSTVQGTGFYLIQKALGTLVPTPAPDAPLGTFGLMYYPQFGRHTSTIPVSVFDLSENTTYTFMILPGYPEITATNTNLRQASPTTLTATTLKAAPTTQSSSISFADQTSNSVTINWLRGNGDGVSVFVNTTNNFTAPTNLNLPTANTAWQNSGQQCVYNGTGTSVSITGIDQVHNYYVRIYEYSSNSANNPNYIQGTATDNPNSIAATIAQWNGSSSSWSTASNWLLETTPSNAQGIIIPNTQNLTAPTISTTETVASVKIEQGGELTIDTDGDLTVNGNFTIEGDANGSGSLLVKGSGSLYVTGSSIFNRYISSIGESGSWHYVSTPTNGTDIMQFTGFYADEWNEPTALWNALDGNSTISVMQGYSIKYSSQSQTINFTGTFNNGNKSTTVTNSNTSNEVHGWNLVGNPYPSAIDWNAESGWTRSDVNATAYFYNGTGYVDYNHVSNTGTASSSVIPAGQGFMIFVDNVSSTTLSMTNDVRVNSASTGFYKNKAPQIALKIENEYLDDQTHITFYPGATDAYDRIIDGHKLLGWDTELPQIYTITPENKQLSINTLSDELLTEKEFLHETNVGYISKINTTLSLSLSKIIDIPDSINILLVDRYANDTINLKQETYSFETQIGEFNNRFSVIFKKSLSDPTGIITNDTGAYAYMAENQLHVILNKSVTSGQIIVYDILGRSIINKSLTTKTHYILPISQNSNIFVVNIFTDKGVLLRKTLVNNR